MAELDSPAELLPPQDVILNARAVMGAIDFDPWSCPDQNLLVQSARYFNRLQENIDDICAQDWNSMGEKRCFMLTRHAKETKRLMHKLLREYRVGRIKEAVVWLQHNESITRMPWLWNFPLCIPYKRLRPCWRDEEIDSFRTFSPAVWSFIAYLPPTESTSEYHTKLARFSVAFSNTGRIVFAEDAGSDDWEKGYLKSTKHAYNYRA